MAKKYQYRTILRYEYCIGTCSALVKKDVNEGTDPKDEGVFDTAVTDAMGEDVNERAFTEIDVIVGDVSCDALRLSAGVRGIHFITDGKKDWRRILPAQVDTATSPAKTCLMIAIAVEW